MISCLQAGFLNGRVKEEFQVGDVSLVTGGV
jgi:hypothetical protein